ncbi:hypothetical protein P691DRAFT_623802, partial [Macrolepiota fuliginosa MF-IS2]
EPKHFSIDLSLELERQLELEGSPPQTPSASATSHSNRGSLDPSILAHIVTGLRKTVEDMTKERDDLLRLLESATTREASLQDTLQLMTEKATDYEEELSAAKKKMKEDEEAIALLRNKVEESRRGLMRLQAESRRQSVAPGALDLSRAGISGFSSPPSSKRASFTPLTGRTGNGHRRISSISVDGNGLGAHLAELHSTPNSPLAPPDPNQPQSSRRSLFRHSPPHTEVSLPPTNVPSPEMEAMKKEVDSLRRELSDTRAELSEANEAKEASEICVKALREFIAEAQVGINTSDSTSVKLPPPPVMTSAEEVKPVPSGSGWGFKLWKADSAPKVPVVTTTTPSPTAVTLSSPAQHTPTVSSAPFSRIGGFFSSRGSVSSTTSSTSGTLQTNAAFSRDSFRNSMSGHSISDTSSIIEPLSPENEPQGV